MICMKPGGERAAQGAAGGQDNGDAMVLDAAVLAAMEAAAAKSKLPKETKVAMKKPGMHLSKSMTSLFGRT